MIKKITFISYICLLLILTVFVTSCKKKYTVNFYIDDQLVETVEVKKGATITPITVEPKDYYSFDGWFFNNKIFNFSTPIKENIELYGTYIHVCENGHNFSNATCDIPKTCIICKATEGNALGHNWNNATCDNPKTCSVCGKTEGEPLTHVWLPATVDAPKTCQLCGKTEGEKIPNVQYIEIFSSSNEVYLNDTISLNAICYPEASIQDVTWSIRTYEGSDASITDEGILTALNSGTVYVTATSQQNKYVSKTITITILHPLIDEEIYDAFNIMTGFGSDASSEIEINYHTHSLKTFVEYTVATDTDFNNVTTVTGTGYYFEDMREDVDSIFTPRNVIRVSLKGLKPNTEYIYRINLGNDTYSLVHHFKTSPNDGSQSSFLVMSDIHFYATYDSETSTYKSNGAEISEQVVLAALNQNPNIGFIATAGDIVDKGGSSVTWDYFFNSSNSLRMMPRVGVAGNHEYYMRATSQTDFRYQKAHYANAYNGPSSQLGATSYFLYNDILFLIIDNEQTIGRTELFEWLEYVLSNVKATYIIAMMHTPIFYEKGETSNNDRDEKLMALFDKYCVDLVLSGHYHSDKYRPNYYNGTTSTDPYLGVNYLGLYEGGTKAGDTSTACGYLIETSNYTITIKRINANGDILSTRIINSKKNQPVIEETKENLINSFNMSLDYETKTCTFTFSDKYYGNVKEVVVNELIRGDINTSMVFPTPSYNKIVISDINQYYDYQFKVTIYFNDGSSHSITKSVPAHIKGSLTYIANSTTSATLYFTTPDPSFDYLIYNYKLIINGQEYATFSSLDEYFEPVRSYTINNLETKNYDICLYALDSSNNIIYILQTNIINEN